MVPLLHLPYNHSKRGHPKWAIRSGPSEATKSNKCWSGYFGSASFLLFSSSFLRGLDGLVHQTMRMSKDKATSASRITTHMFLRLLYIYKMPL